MVGTHEHLQVAQVSVALLDAAAQHFFVRVHVVVLLLLRDALLDQLRELGLKHEHFCLSVDWKLKLLGSVLLCKPHVPVRTHTL